MIADPITKGLQPKTFKEYVHRMGLGCIEDWLWWCYDTLELINVIYFWLYQIISCSLCLYTLNVLNKEINVSLRQLSGH